MKENENMTLHMDNPVWVWLYDYGAINYPEMWKNNSDTKLCHPQAHTFAFTNFEDAKDHPNKMKWPDDHNYVLQKVYLN